MLCFMLSCYVIIFSASSVDVIKIFDRKKAVTRILDYRFEFCFPRLGRIKSPSFEERLGE